MLYMKVSVEAVFVLLQCDGQFRNAYPQLAGAMSQVLMQALWSLFFRLHYHWLHSDKRVLDHDFPKKSGPLLLHFAIRSYQTAVFNSQLTCSKPLPSVTQILANSQSDCIIRLH